MAKGQEFLDAYKKGNYKEEPSAYGAYAYDAANAIIDGLKVSLKDAKSAKEARPKATIDAIGKASFDGVTGKVAFDQYGDSTTKHPHRLQGDGRGLEGRQDRRSGEVVRQRSR
jgi:branched-chain amino acid transport system substrate-binding protein